MNSLLPKSPAQSAVQSRYLLMPHQANPYGTAFGGVIMAWIDMVASLAAQKHAQREVVTAGIDSLAFLKPIRIGDHVVLDAVVTYVGATSMEVAVQVRREDPLTAEQALATTAYLTFVALDQNKKPVPIGPLSLQNDLDKQRFEQARLRVQARQELRRKLEQVK
jgi:acyl-CoA hydrolase